MEKECLNSKHKPEVKQNKFEAMKRFTISLLLSIFLIGGSGAAFADRHHDNDKGRYEHRDKGHNHKKNDKKDHKPSKKDKHHFDKKRPGRPGYFGKPSPGPVPRPNAFHINHDRRFHDMVKHAAYGGSDVRVWQINADTYIVKYRKGRKWYTRRFYPNSGRYDAPGLININWNPMSSWTLLPSININIPL